MKPWNTIIIGAVALLLLIAVVFLQRKPLASSAPAAEPAAAPAANATAARSPVLVELFTSEGCSSCPPADELLSQLDRTQSVPGAEVIALSQHVDYWNRLGWTDPYSSAEFSARQGDYSTAFGRDGVYTPQMIVDGQAEFVGSNREQAREAIASAARAPKAAVTLSRSETAAADPRAIQLQVRVEKLPQPHADDTAEVLLAITESGLRSDVSRGENSGRRLMHTAVVRRLSVIGTGAAKDGEAFNGASTITVADGWKVANLRAVVFVQERQSRKVLGAASISLAR